MIPPENAETVPIIPKYKEKAKISQSPPKEKEKPIKSESPTTLFRTSLETVPLRAQTNPLHQNGFPKQRKNSLLEPKNSFVPLSVQLQHIKDKIDEELAIYIDRITDTIIKLKLKLNQTTTNINPTTKNTALVVLEQLKKNITKNFARNCRLITI